MKRLLVFSFITLLVYGCHYPTSEVRVLDDRPTIVIQNAPKGAFLFVDGLNMGQARLYDGREKALVLEPGTHEIEVTSQGNVIHSERVFLGDGELKTLKVHSSGATK
jgi:hypothetical protein